MNQEEMARLEASVKTLKAKFKEAVIVLEDCADRFDLLEGYDDLQKDIQTILDMEEEVDKL